MDSRFQASMASGFQIPVIQDTVFQLPCFQARVLTILVKFYWRNFLRGDNGKLVVRHIAPNALNDKTNCQHLRNIVF